MHHVHASIIAQSLKTKVSDLPGMLPHPHPKTHFSNQTPHRIQDFNSFIIEAAGNDNWKGSPAS
jgi:hypothetical protein